MGSDENVREWRCRRAAAPKTRQIASNSSTLVSAFAPIVRSTSEPRIAAVNGSQRLVSTISATDGTTQNWEFSAPETHGYRDGANSYKNYFGLKGTDPSGLYFEAPSIHDCWDRWGVKCQQDCDEIYGADWFPNYTEWGKCKAGCLSHLVACGEEFVPTIVRLECDSPECNRYENDDDYAGTDAKCFCKCAGNSDWSQYVRGCLRQMYDGSVDPHEAT